MSVGRWRFFVGESRQNLGKSLGSFIAFFFFGLFDFTFFSEELINLKTGQIHRKKMSSPNQNIVPYTLPPNNDKNGEGAAAAVHVGFQILNRERRLGGR